MPQPQQRQTHFVPAQLNMVARLVAGFLTYRWFDDLFDDEAEPYMVRLFLRVYLDYSQGRLPTHKEATQFIGGGHTKTTRKYVEMAKGLGYLKIARSKQDRRKTLVYPTEKMLDLMEKELVSLGRWLTTSVPETLARKNAEAEIYPLSGGQPVEHAFARGPHTLEELEEEYVVNETSETIKLTPRNVLAYVRRAGALARMGKPDAAVADLTKAIELRPRDAHLLELRSRNLWAAGKRTETLSDLNEVVVLAPGWSVGYARRAIVSFLTGNRSQAEADLLVAKKLGAHFRLIEGQGMQVLRVEHEGGAFEDLPPEIAEVVSSLAKK